MEVSRDEPLQVVGDKFGGHPPEELEVEVERPPLAADLLLAGDNQARGRSSAVAARGGSGAGWLRSTSCSIWRSVPAVPGARGAAPRAARGSSHGVGVALERGVVGTAFLRSAPPPPLRRRDWPPGPRTGVLRDRMGDAEGRLETSMPTTFITLLMDSRVRGPNARRVHSPHLGNAGGGAGDVYSIGLTGRLVGINIRHHANQVCVPAGLRIEYAAQVPSCSGSAIRTRRELAI